MFFGTMLLFLLVMFMKLKEGKDKWFHCIHSLPCIYSLILLILFLEWQCEVVSWSMKCSLKKCIYFLKCFFYIRHDILNIVAFYFGMLHSMVVR